jgi:hypothetical protein
MAKETLLEKALNAKDYKNIDKLIKRTLNLNK